jgi:peptidoglycan/LPS O-acetylase OafA/YrhL
MTTLHRRSVFLLSLAALGAAGMFLGPDGWLGIDIGHVGSAVLYAALWLFVIHLSKHSEGAFPGDAPLAERQAWTSVVFIALIAFHWVNFIVALGQLGAGANQISNPASRAFSVNLGMLIFGWVVVAGVLRSGNRETVELDERDLRIQHAASRAGSGLMAMLIIGLIAALATQPELLAPWLRPLIVANALIGLLIANTLTENVYIVTRYRRQRG